MDRVALLLVVVALSTAGCCDGIGRLASEHPIKTHIDTQLIEEKLTKKYHPCHHSLCFIRFCMISLSNFPSGPRGVNYTGSLFPFKRVVWWKCINLDSRLQYKAVFEESPLVKPRRHGDSDENERGRGCERQGESKKQNREMEEIHSSAFSANLSLSQSMKITAAHPLRL